MTKIVLTLAVAFQLFVVGATFQYNLPNWCANPTVGGNHLVQPLCK